MARLIIEAGFTASELVSIAHESAGIDFRDIARSYATWTEQIAGLINAAELRNVRQELIAGLLQARADNPAIQAAILGNDMQSQSDQQISNFRLSRLEEKIDRMDTRLQGMDARLAAAEAARTSAPAGTTGLDRFAVLILALVMLGMFLFNTFGAIATR